MTLPSTVWLAGRVTLTSKNFGAKTSVSYCSTSVSWRVRRDWREMPSNKVVKKVISPWTEDDMQSAMHLRRSSTLSTRAIAKQFNVDEATLRRRVKKETAGVALKKAGRKAALSEDTEHLMARCVRTLCQNGFSPVMMQIRVCLTNITNRVLAPWWIVLG